MTPTPIRHMAEAEKANISGLFLCIIQNIYGTIITLIAVKKAFFPAVVIEAPKVWKAYPRNCSVPIIIPAFKSSLVSSVNLFLNTVYSIKNPPKNHIVSR